MTTFSEYWKEKAQKRRKSWAAKAKRFAEQHTQLEDIRKEVYLPLDYGVNFSFEDYKPEHFIKQEQLQTRLIRGIKDGSIEVKVSKKSDKG
jgi:hypothetical protein